MDFSSYVLNHHSNKSLSCQFGFAAMAMLQDTVSATAPIVSPADKFYDFFKYHMIEILAIFPKAFKSAEVIEGEEGTVGCVIQWTYVVGGSQVTAKVRTEAIDDEAKSITFAVLEGDVLQLYKSFKATLTVSTGSAKWTLDYEKASPLSPPPELYLALAITVSTLVDLELLLN